MLALLASLAFASPCLDDGMPEGPVIGGFLDGDLGSPHRACGRTEAGFDGSAYAVIETENFYGHLIGSGTFDGSVALGTTELFATLEAVRYDSVITPIPGSYLGLGHTTLGVSHQVSSSDTRVLAVNGRLVLPTAFGLYHNAYPLAADIGFATRLKAAERLFVNTQLGLLGSLAVSGAPQPRGGVAATLGGEWRAGRAFALALDVNGTFGYTAPLDVLAAALGIRFSDGKRFGFEIAATVPLVGRERSLATLDLRASVRFD